MTPADLAPLQFAENCGSTKPVPCVALMNANWMPALFAVFQLMAPFHCDTSTPLMLVFPQATTPLSCASMSSSAAPSGSDTPEQAREKHMVAATRARGAKSGFMGPPGDGAASLCPS